MIVSMFDRNRPSPPRQVQVALALVTANCIVGLLRSVLMQRWERPIVAVAGVAVFVAACLLWLYGLARGLNWLRWLTVVLGALGCITAPLTISRMADSAQIALYKVQWVITAPAVILLALPAAHNWYARKVS